MSELESLMVRLAPLTPAHTINQVSDCFVNHGHLRFLSLPIVSEGKPVGVISRHAMQNIFMMRYGRELVGRKQVTTVMNPRPLLVELDETMEQACQYITLNAPTPITEDFIITRDGRYQGVGHVVDLLRAMDRQVALRNQELVNAYSQLKASQAQLVQSEKMASLGQMVAGVAHEINTPLGYVKNNLSLARDLLDQMRLQLAAYDELMAGLMSGEADEAAVASSLGAINDLKAAFDAAYPVDDVQGLFDDTLHGVGQISEIVVNLRDFSRLDQAPVDNVSLNQCLDSALLIARNVLKHKAEVLKEYGEMPEVSCSPSQINQVFLNLLTNAAQAIEGSGRVLVKTYADERYVHAEVRDNGRGIPPDHLKKIFDPFFTTKPIGQGTGLGLYISYQIVQKHGGLLRVASRPGVGTRFCVSLPRPPALN